MVILVCGGREFRDEERLKEVLDEVDGWSLNGNITVVQGGARGADAMAARWALNRGHKLITEAADWATHGRKAGPLRNQAMIDKHKPTQGVVFPGGAGTLDMLTRLFRAQINTWVVGD